MPDKSTEEEYIAKLEKRVAELEVVLTDAAVSLIGYDKSYGGGGGQAEADDIARLLGYDGDLIGDDVWEWFRIRPR